MAYGDYSGPDKPDKGHEGGSCNRRLCQDNPASFFNHGSRSWYCASCADEIGNDPVNLRDWNMNFRPKMGHPMFETRADMDKRAKK